LIKKNIGGGVRELINENINGKVIK